MVSPSSRDVARLAQHAMVELFAARGRPFQQLGAAVDRDAFLVAGDQERDRAFRLAAVRGEMIERRRDLAGDRALHVHRAAAVQHAAGDVARERRMRPRLGIAGRHHVGVAGEHQMRRARADAGVEVLDVGGAGLGERHPVHGEARALQQRFEKRQRAAFRRRHRRAANQIAGDGDGIGGWSCSGFIRPCAAHVNSAAQAGVRDRRHGRGASGSGPYGLAPMVPRRQPSSTKAQTPMANAAKPRTLAIRWNRP